MYSSRSSCEHKSTIQQSVPTPINKTHKLESHRSIVDPIWWPSGTSHMLRQYHNYNKLSLPSHSKYLYCFFYLKYDKWGHFEREPPLFVCRDFVLGRASRFKFQFYQRFTIAKRFFFSLLVDVRLSYCLKCRYSLFYSGNNLWARLHLDSIEFIGPSSPFHQRRLNRNQLTVKTPWH